MPTFTEEAEKELQGKTVFSEEEYKELVKQGKIVPTKAELEGDPLSTNGEIRITMIYPDVPYMKSNIVQIKNKTYLEVKKHMDEFTKQF